MNNNTGTLHNKNERRRRIVIQNIAFTWTGYTFGLAITIAAIQLGFTSMPWFVVPSLYIPGFLAPIPFLIITQKKELITKGYALKIFFAQFVIWSFLYFILVYHLREARVISMFLAYTALLYFMSLFNFRQTLAALLVFLLCQIGISYIATEVMNQPGSFREDLFYIATFFPSLIVLSMLAGQFYRQRNDLYQAREIVKVQANDLNAAMEELEAINENLTETNQDLRTARNIARMDLDMAVNVQKNFLPQEIPDVKSWKAAFYYKAMTDVSGDFYDFYLKGEELWGTGIFDVSGHGIASGLVTMIAKSIIFREFSDGSYKNLGHVMEEINEGLILEIGAVDNFLTGILLRLSGNNIEYVNAGHPDIYVKSGKKVYVPPPADRKKFGGALLGLPALTGPYHAISFTVNPGDFIFLYTDCILEDKNSKNEIFGSIRLMHSLTKAKAETPQDLLEAVMQDFLAFTGSEDFTDDLTVIVLQYCPG